MQVLKYPPVGMETMTQPSSWRWFHLMEQALSGRLAGSATIVQPSLLDEDEEHGAASPAPPNSGADFSELSAVETESLEGVGMLGEVLELSESDSPVETVADGGHGTQPATDKDRTATLYATMLARCTAGTKEPPASSRNIAAEAADVNRKLVDLQREKHALEREQAEFDRELISLEKDRELLNKDMANLERDRVAVDRDRAAMERDRAAVERDRVFLDRDRALLDRDRAFLDRDRAFLERAREDLEREKVLLRRERAALDGNQAEMTTEKEVLLQTRLYKSLMVADLDPDQLETRQRLVSLFQKLVEKL